MVLRLTLCALLAVLAACSHGATPLPRCDGVHRRPANPHGSALVEQPVTPAPEGEAPAVVGPPGGCA